MMKTLKINRSRKPYLNLIKAIYGKHTVRKVSVINSTFQLLIVLYKDLIGTTNRCALLIFVLGQKKIKNFKRSVQGEMVLQRKRRNCLLLQEQEGSGGNIKGCHLYILFLTLDLSCLIKSPCKLELVHSLGTQFSLNSCQNISNR